jgi:hypothetical protein
MPSPATPFRNFLRIFWDEPMPFHLGHRIDGRGSAASGLFAYRVDSVGIKFVRAA